MKREVLEEIFQMRRELAQVDPKEKSFDGVNFSGKDLNEYNMSGLYFANCNFDNCKLIDTDMNYSMFLNCSFRNAIVSTTETNMTYFENCDFYREGVKN